MIKLMILEESLHPKSYSKFSSSNFLKRLKSESVTDCFKHESKKKKTKKGREQPTAGVKTCTPGNKKRSQIQPKSKGLEMLIGSKKNNL